MRNLDGGKLISQEKIETEMMILSLAKIFVHEENFF
jgi:hypothetical protein